MKIAKFMVAVLGAATLIGCASEATQQNECSKEQAVIETIMTRRSVRNYTSEPVDREQMAKILECGMYAPSAMNMQPWAVRVVDAPDFIEGVTNIALEQNPELKEQEGFRNLFRNAPTVAFIACPVESYSGEFDCGLLSENMMLAAWSMGIGSCCLGSVVPVMNSEAAKPYMERLQLPDGYKLMLAIAFGYPEPNSTQEPERDLTKAYYIE
ncbi:MAG: nitroreductase [Alistipes sp.]|nr:nitroreductase [Alistipes sp.]